MNTFFLLKISIPIMVFYWGNHKQNLCQLTVFIPKLVCPELVRPLTCLCMLVRRLQTTISNLMKMAEDYPNG